MINNILITGGTRGIGEELVIHYSKKYENVFFTYINSDEKCIFLEKKYKNIKGFKLDITDYKLVEETIKNIIKKYNINVLINNAGILLNKKLIDLSYEEWMSVINTNLTSIFNITKNILPNMIENNYGRIINISSISGLKGFSGQTAYSSSKMGIIGFTKSLSKEVGKYNILVNSISPGFIETDMLNNINSNYIEKIKKEIPLKNFSKKNEIVKLINMLIETEYITGENIIIDGGLIN